MKVNRLNPDGSKTAIELTATHICFSAPVTEEVAKRNPSFKDYVTVALSNGVVMIIDVTPATLSGIMQRAL